MDSKTESDQCYNELIKQIKKLFIDIQLQNHLKERLQRDSYQYIDIYGQLAEYHEAISSLIHSVSYNLVKADNAEQVQKTSDKDLKKLHSDAVSLHAVISQAKDDKQQNIKRTSSFIDYYSYESRNTSSSNISSLNNSAKELIKLENERFELENQLYSKTKQMSNRNMCL